MTNRRRGLLALLACALFLTAFVLAFFARDNSAVEWSGRLIAAGAILSGVLAYQVLRRAVRSS